MEVFYPSCNLTAASPEAAKKIRAYMLERMPAAGCCRFDKKDYHAEKTVYFCQSCRNTIEKRSDIQTENLFVYLNKDKQFIWPDYSGLTLTYSHG